MLHQNLNINVKAPIKDLVAALKANKTKHLQDYEKAVSVYFDDIIGALNALKKRAEEKDMKHHYGLHMSPPINNEKLYDKYIGFLSMSVVDTVEISAADYGCIVDDNWDWAVSASAMNATYSSKFRG